MPNGERVCGLEFTGFDLFTEPVMVPQVESEPTVCRIDENGVLTCGLEWNGPDIFYDSEPNTTSSPTYQRQDPSSSGTMDSSTYMPDMSNFLDPHYVPHTHN